MPMCRRASNMWKPKPSPVSVRPKLLIISDVDAEEIGSPAAKSRKAEPNHHRRERPRSFKSPPRFVKTVLRLFFRNQ